MTTMRAARAGFVVVMVMATLAARPSVAQAQVILPEEAKLFRSPQHFGFELRFGPYHPNVDSEFNRADRHPYQTFFGSGSHLMTQLEFDYQFFHRMGSLAVGATVGYFSVSGTNPAKNGSGNTADSSNFQIIPFSVSAVYRFDYFFQERRFPLVPYGKLGLDYALWRVNDANGEIATDASGGRARGGVPGWHVAAGLSLVLDFIDPDGARSFDDELGVNHTHLFIEFSHADISGLGASNKIHLGDDTWMAGLLFEF